ncbi:MAG: hypothetical protein NBV68_17195 [Erythrobacter sp.]|uniref:hypothetical protein n=1 Tax=Erythrobacter sp. TaxID=1042 RepID=UPI0025ED01A1|nr:hypothetical protein [Erythrobacter sp.]MCM0001110.1 hypothetical protein [Erythrobacter sp.]
MTRGLTLLLAGAALVGPAAQAAPADCMSTDPAMWLTSDAQRALRTRLMGYFVCPDDAVNGPLADRVACNYFAGKVIADLYGFDDFALPGGGWMTANAIASEAASNPAWRRIGGASDQAALTAAARAATAGRPVIAVKTGSPGHVALVLPGDVKRSGTWDRDVPNSASFSLDNVDKAYAFCRLSYAFGSANGVILYERRAS